MDLVDIEAMINQEDAKLDGEFWGQEGQKKDTKKGQGQTLGGKLMQDLKDLYGDDMMDDFDFDFYPDDEHR